MKVNYVILLFINSLFTASVLSLRLLVVVLLERN